MLQRVNGYGQEMFISRVLLGEQHLTWENVFAGKPNVGSIHLQPWGYHLTFFWGLAQKPSGTVQKRSLF